MADRISELRLTAFKSFRDVAVPLAPLTVPGFVRAGDANIGRSRNVLARLT